MPAGGNNAVRACPTTVRDLEFSVVDTETTGLFPDAHDRIIEIAIVRTDYSGKLINEYCTLVNPHRDLGPTHIHHISASDVRSAPSFEEIAGDVLVRLHGAVFTSFNAPFDLRFLRAEFRRLGRDIPSVEPLCLMRLAGIVAPDLPGRKLEVCCRHFGIHFTETHSAYGDALATAKLLCQCLTRAEKSCGSLLESLPGRRMLEQYGPWPDIPPSGKSLSRGAAAAKEKTETTYIQRLVSCLPSAAAVDPTLDEYLSLLDRVVEDRVVTEEEARSLLNKAQQLGFCQESAHKAHTQYMRDLIAVALADGKISPREEADLHEVRTLLSLSEAEFQRILLEVKARRERIGSEQSPATTAASSFDGLKICFTGEFSFRIKGEAISREFAEAVAQRKGMIVKRSVTKDLDYLVTADPHSMSGKAKRARQYGTRVIAEAVFWQMMGIDVE